VARKSIQSQEGTEGCLTRPDGKAVVNSCEIRVGANRTLCRALGPAKENNHALEPPKGYIVSGCRELKRKFRINMPIAQQVVWLLLLALPIASIAWTVTHEDIFREPRDFCARRSKDSRSLLCRKFFYLFTCEYCFSHWVTAAFLVITRYKLLYDDWRGYLISLFALVYVSNFYTGLLGHVKLEVKKDRAEIKAIEAEVEAKKTA
jgi:hypothetical protein